MFPFKIATRKSFNKFARQAVALSPTALHAGEAAGGWPLYEPNLSQQRPSGSEPKGKGLALFEQALATKRYGWLRRLDLNQRPSGYEPERSILSLADSVALTPVTGLKTLYSGPILCPSFAQVLDSKTFHQLARRCGGDRKHTLFIHDPPPSADY